MTDVNSFIEELLESDVSADYRAAAASLVNCDTTVDAIAKVQLIYALTCSELRNEIPDMRNGNPIRESMVDQMEIAMANGDHETILGLSVAHVALAKFRFVPLGKGTIIDDYIVDLMEGIPKNQMISILKELDMFLKEDRLLSPKHPSAFSRGVKNADGSFSSELTDLGRGIAYFFETHSDVSLDATAQNIKNAKIMKLLPKLASLHS